MLHKLSPKYKKIYYQNFKLAIYVESLDSLLLNHFKLLKIPYIHIETK